jgi:hypothetical protein
MASDGGVDAAAYLEFRGGILRHIAMEERVLMPAAKQANAGKPLPVVPRLRLDHHAIALLVIPTPTPELLRTLAEVLAPHNVLERLAVEGVDALYARMLAVPELPLAAHVDTEEIRAYLARTLEDRRRLIESR